MHEIDSIRWFGKFYRRHTSLFAFSIYSNKIPLHLSLWYVECQYPGLPGDWFGSCSKRTHRYDTWMEIVLSNGDLRRIYHDVCLLKWDLYYVAGRTTLECFGLCAGEFDPLCVSHVYRICSSKIILTWNCSFRLRSTTNGLPVRILLWSSTTLGFGFHQEDSWKYLVPQL